MRSTGLVAIFDYFRPNQIRVRVATRCNAMPHGERHFWLFSTAVCRRAAAVDTRDRKISGSEVNLERRFGECRGWMRKRRYALFAWLSPCDGDGDADTE